MRKITFILSFAFVALFFSSCDYQPVITGTKMEMVKVASESGDTFYIGKYEVRQKEWRALMGTNPSYNKGGDMYPVENVTYDEVMEFISKLNEKTKQNYRLPTRREWQIAAYAANREFYPYSGCEEESLKEYAWYAVNSKDVHAMPVTHEVGTKKANGIGLYDMTGNVSEMTCDTSVLKEHVYTKGGTCYSSVADCKITAVDSLLISGVRGIRCGFRLAKDVE